MPISWSLVLLHPDPAAEMMSFPPLLVYLPSKGNGPLAVMTSLAPNALLGLAASLLWLTETTEIIASTTATTIVRATKAVALAVSTLLSRLASISVCCSFLFSGRAGLSPCRQPLPPCPSSSYLVQVVLSPPLSVRSQRLSAMPPFSPLRHSLGARRLSQQSHPFFSEPPKRCLTRIYGHRGSFIHPQVDCFLALSCSR